MSSLYGALRSGVSGMFVNSQAMAMISDNIANVNTTGYKVSKAKFSTLVTNNPSPTLYSSGGVQSQVWREYDAQGLLQASSRSTDMAISGDGFFAVTDSVTQDAATGEWSRNGSILYTRAAEFRPDENGNLVNAAGYYLLGWEANSAGTGFTETNVQSAFEVVNVSARSSDPIPTTEYNLSANLNADAATDDNFDIELQIVDRQGSQRTLTLTFEKTGTADEWNLFATLDNGQFLDLDVNDDGTFDADTDATTGISDAEITTHEAGGDTATAGTTVALGVVTFDASGNLSSIVSDTTTTLTNAAGTTYQVVGGDDNAGSGVLQVFIDHDGTYSATSVDDAVAINLNLGTPGTTTGLSQAAGTSTINTYSDNGQQFGSLTGVTVNDVGVVTALFDNGATRDLYKVPVNTFANPNGLQEQTGNVYIQTDESGEAIAHTASTGGAGAISPSSIESSTVDLATEFTDMITTQRAYSANTKIITTADEMLEELIRTKR
ncbi:flagellar hook protein FlgE [Curvivirga sp.]|uniref:flagellar hook protein FlgE n=1 Tax=Curvivirga sp. TaxID=2856848 RepID=UPI003B591C0E